jgi:hypothetical protein
MTWISKELQNDKDVVLAVVKQNRKAIEIIDFVDHENITNDKEIQWISMKYFRIIKSIQNYDLNFKFIKKRSFHEIE